MRHQKRVAFRLSLRLASLLLPLLVATVPAHAESWTKTNTLAFPLTKNIVDAGLLPDTAPMRLTVALRLNRREELDDFIDHLTTPGDPLYGRYLSTDEFVARFAPSEADAQAVADYLRGSGFSGIRIAPNRVLITADGSASKVRRAFRTELRQFDVNGHRGFANTRDVHVPYRLRQTVLSVLGLQNIAEVRTMLVEAGTQALAPNAYNPTAFPEAYNVGAVGPASRTSVGIIAFGNVSQTIKDLRDFETQNGLPEIPVKKMPVDGASLITAGVAEWNLDSQTIQAMAGGSLKSIYFYLANPITAQKIGLGFLTSTFNRVVTDNTVKIINASLGNCESLAKLQGVMAADDQIFAQAVAQGQTFVFASGDGGSNTGCIAHEGQSAEASYPASSPYVVAVGGTSLTTTSAGGGSYVGETAWSGGGGGVSKYEKAPRWQKSVVSGLHRSVPDIAFDADPYTGANILVRGELLTVGGTSLAAPLFTGTLARAQTANFNRLGFAAPTIYRIADHSPAPFHDVTTGSNGAYDAGPGFDQTTGFGSPDISVFVENN